MQVIFLLVSLFVAQNAEEPIEILSPREACEQKFAERVNKLNRIRRDIEELPNSNDYSKLSEQAIQKIEKPLRDQLARVIADKSLSIDSEFPVQAKKGEVFSCASLQRKTKGLKERYVLSVVDAETVIANVWYPTGGMRFQGGLLVGRPVTTILGEHEAVVVSGLEKSEFQDKKGYPLKMPGTWQRMDDIKLDGVTYMHIKRWPYEEQTRKEWPKFFETAELDRIQREAKAAE